MALKEKSLWIGGAAYGPDTPVLDEDGNKVGIIEVDVINQNVVITVRRIDESKFGPVSVVVV